MQINQLLINIPIAKRLVAASLDWAFPDKMPVTSQDFLPPCLPHSFFS